MECLFFHQFNHVGGSVVLHGGWLAARCPPISLTVSRISVWGVLEICMLSGHGRRERNVGPGSAQILRISGFVNSKTDGENALVLSGFSCDLQKKRKVFKEKCQRFHLQKNGLRSSAY